MARAQMAPTFETTYGTLPASARSIGARDIWAQGGEPAWRETCNACMAERGWRRTVALGPGAL